MSNQACRSTYYRVKRDELPVCCPMSNQRLWDAHPRVYLPIEKTGRVTCPYCGARYELVGDDAGC